MILVMKHGRRRRSTIAVASAVAAAVVVQFQSSLSNASAASSSAWRDRGAMSTKINDSLPASSAGPSDAGPLSTPTRASTQASSSFLQWGKREGVGWKAWTSGDAILSSQYGYPCRWVTYRSSTNGKTMEMCVHRETDYISNAIESSGTWPECRILAKLWNDKRAFKESNLFLDIGSNIGACTVEFLLSTNATIVAVEPHPKNLFCITSTLNRNSEYVAQGRVTILPFAVGHESGQNVSMAIFPAYRVRKTKRRMNNFGGAHVIPNWALAKSNASSTKPARMPHLVTVPIVALDDVIQHAQPRLIKLDVEGYECYALEGMKNHIKIALIFTEVFSFMLEAASCDAKGLLTRLWNSHNLSTFKLINETEGTFENLSTNDTNELPEIMNVMAVKEH